MPISPHASAKRPSVAHPAEPLAIVPFEGRPVPKISREAFGVLHCLDGYLKTLLPDTSPPSSTALVAAPPLKRPRTTTETDAASRKVALRPTRNDSPLLSQLQGHNRLAAPLRSLTPRRPERHDAPLKLSAEREQIINDALTSVLDGQPLIKPVFWPHFEMIVDIQSLRDAYPDLANMPAPELAHAVGGMADRDLQAIGELWRQRHALSAKQFIDLVTPQLTCPVSLEIFSRPVLTLDAHNISLPALAQFYRQGPRSLFNNTPAMGTSIYGYPNRRLIAISNALWGSDDELARTSAQGRKFWEAGALFREWSRLILEHNFDVDCAPELSVEQAAKTPRIDDPELQPALRTLARIDSVEQMMAPVDGGTSNPRGELLHRALAANELLFRQLAAIVEDMRHGRLHDGRVRLACDAALINAPVHATRGHLMKFQASIFIAALRQSNDLGSIVRRIFFEQTAMERRREVVEQLLRPVDVEWLRKYDRHALPYLQMSWYSIFHPSPACRTRWSTKSTNDKLDSLTYALWVESRDLNLTTLFLPFEDMTPLGAKLSIEQERLWEERAALADQPWYSTLEFRRSRASSASSTYSLRHQLEGLAGSGFLLEPRTQRPAALSLARSTRSLRSLRSARQSRESVLLSGPPTPTSERQIALTEQRSEVR